MYSNPNADKKIITLFVFLSLFLLSAYLLSSRYRVYYVLVGPPDIAIWGVLQQYVTAFQTPIASVNNPPLGFAAVG